MPRGSGQCLRDKKMVQFWDDPIIEDHEVNITCETCSMENCSDRVAEPYIIESLQSQKKVKAALEKILSV